MTWQRWTDAETEFVKNNYLQMTCAQMVQCLPGRSERSIWHIIKRLGLERPKPKVGDKYNRLEIMEIYAADRGSYRTTIARVKCECGTEKDVLLTSVVNEHTKSCGCLKNEKASERTKLRNRTHGNSGHPLYSQWVGMIGRCTYESHIAYRNYGGRGIRVCDEWYDFGVFLEWCLKNGWSPGLTLDRKETNGNYEPNNCRFLTRKQQCRNKRNNRLLTAFGETKTAIEWSEDPRCRTTCANIFFRVRLGWDDERIITTPTRRLQRHV